MPDLGPEAVPSLEAVRAAFASIITRIVQYFQNGPHRYASVKEIAAGVGLDNEAECETIYSALDPYSEFAEKRNPEKPLLFRRVAPGEYEFLGYTGDPLDLTKIVRIKDPFLREAYGIFSEQIDRIGQGAELKGLAMSERVASFHRNLLKSPIILSMAGDRLQRKHERERVIGTLSKNI